MEKKSRVTKFVLKIVIVVHAMLLVGCVHPSQRTQKEKTGIVSVSDSTYPTQHRRKMQIDSTDYYYKDTTVCNEETTSGMIDWGNRLQKVYDTRATHIQHKLVACKLAPNIPRGEIKLQLQKAINNEIAYWKELEELIRHFNSIVTDIQKIQNGGGSIYGIICADNQRELSYIRYACLLEDLAVLNATSPQKSPLKNNLCIDSLYIEMRKCRPSVSSHAIRDYEDLSEHDAASRAKYLNEAYSFPVVKRGVENWLNARAQVANLLPPNYGIAYNNHTIRTLRSLIHLYRGMEQGV